MNYLKGLKNVGRKGWLPILLCLEGSTVTLGAQDFTAAVWKDYTDSYGIIHTTQRNDPKPEPWDNNGLLYTSEACVIMQLQNVKYDEERTAIRTRGLPAYQVKPGLFKRAPQNLTDFESPDDWIGLGALAGVCGFPEVARAILDYGNGGDQVSGATVFGQGIGDIGAGWRALLRKGLHPGQLVPYNYNNVNPNAFDFHTWVGAYPAIITHWKLAAGERPTSDELRVWAVALLFSGRSNPTKDIQDHWLQAWLMVLTYEMSRYHSAAADEAVSEWWDLLHQKYPQGIKQTMTDYLAQGAADANPLSKYIEDFQEVRNASAAMVDSSGGLADLFGHLGGLLSMNCGGIVQVEPCIADSDFSPKEFLDPLTVQISTLTDGVDAAQASVTILKDQLSALQTVVNGANDSVNAAVSKLNGFQAQNIAVQQRLSDLAARKVDIIAKGLDKVHLPGHWIPPKKVLGVPVTPPIWIPGSTKNSPNFEALLGSVTDATNQANAIQKAINQAQTEVENARKRLTDATTNLDALKFKLELAQQVSAKAKAALDEAKGTFEYLQAVVQNIIPGVLLPVTP